MRAIFFVSYFILAFLSSSKGFSQVNNPADFFRDPYILQARISPNGKKVATIKIEDGKQIIEILDLIHHKGKRIFNAGDYSQHTEGKEQKNPSFVSKLAWLDSRHIAVQFTEFREGIEELISTKIKRRLLIIDTQKSGKNDHPIYSVRTKGWLVATLPDMEGTFLYAKSGSYSKIYTLNINHLSLDSEKLGKLDRIDGGQFVKSNEVARVKGFSLRWFMSNSGSPESVLAYTDKDTISLLAFEGKGQESKKIHEWKIGDSETESMRFLIPIAKAPGKHKYFCVDAEEEFEKSIYQVDYDSKEDRLVYQTNSYKVVELLQSSTNELLGVRVLNNGHLSNEYIHNHSNPDNQDETKNELVEFSAVTSTTLDEQFAIAFYESHNNPGDFVLIDAGSGKQLKKLGSVNPALSNKIDSHQITGQVTVEGEEIHYLLTAPGDKGQYPLIVMPHGGPIGVHDTPYFSNIVQFFVSEGFAVLRVNFRGSSGYTEAFRDAGKKQWGKLMLEDIYQTTLEVLSLKNIIKGQVCSFGASYGGYAAIMLSIKHPEIYNCAASFAGVYDINLYINSLMDDEDKFNWALDNIGNPEKNYDELKQVSPLFLAEKIQAPMFIAHGKNDDVVSSEQAKRFKYMVEKHNKKAIWHIDLPMGHSFGDEKNATDLMLNVVDFLKQNIKEHGLKR